MSLVKSLTVFINGDIKDFKAKIGEAKTAIGSLQSSLSGMSTKVGIAFNAIGGAVTGFMGLCLKAAGDGEKNIAQLNQVIKSTGGVSGMTAQSAMDLAGSLQRVTTFSKGSIIEGENLLLTFTNIHKDVFPQTTEACLDLSTAMGQDMKTSAIQIGKALNDPIQGISTLHRVGVSFTQQQKDQIKALVESGHTMEAQKIILKELATEFGGQARAAANTWEGQIRNLLNTVMSLRSEIGKALLPVFKDLVSKIKPIIESFVDWVKAHNNLIQKGAPVALALGLISTAIGGLMLILPTLISGFAALSGVIAAVFWPVSIVIGVLAGLYLAWKNNFMGIQDVTAKVWVSIKAVLAQWVGYWNVFLAYCQGVWTSLRAAFSAWYQAHHNQIVSLGNSIRTVLVGAWTTVRNAFVTAWTNIKAVLLETRQIFINWFNEHREQINKFVENVKNIFLPIWEQIKESFIAAWAGIKAFWDEISPYLKQAWDVIVQFIQVGLEQFLAFWNKHWETIRDVLQETWNMMASIVKTVWEAISGTIKLALQVFTGDWNGAWETVKNGLSRVWNAMKDIFSSAIGAIKGAWDTFAKWITDSIDAVLEKIGSLVKKIPGVQTAINAGKWVNNNMIPAFASGGVMPFNGMALVGEYGPELVKLPVGSRIYNNSESKGMAGGSTVNMGGITITINTTGGVDRGMGAAIADEIYSELKRKGIEA